MKELFRHLAEYAAHAVGSYWAFLIALLTERDRHRWEAEDTPGE